MMPKFALKHLFGFDVFKEQLKQAYDACFRAGHGHIGDNDKCSFAVFLDWVFSMLEKHPLQHGDILLILDQGVVLSSFKLLPNIQMLGHTALMLRKNKFDEQGTRGNYLVHRWPWILFSEASHKPKSSC